MIGSGRRFSGLYTGLSFLLGASAAVSPVSTPAEVQQQSWCGSNDASEHVAWVSLSLTRQVLFSDWLSVSPKTTYRSHHTVVNQTKKRDATWRATAPVNVEQNLKANKEQLVKGISPERVPKWSAAFEYPQLDELFLDPRQDWSLPLVIQAHDGGGMTYREVHSDRLPPRWSPRRLPVSSTCHRCLVSRPRASGGMTVLRVPSATLSP